MGDVKIDEIVETRKGDPRSGSPFFFSSLPTLTYP
jgi:hypothetical protein